MEGIKFIFDLSNIKEITLNKIKEEISKKDIPAMKNTNYVDYKFTIDGRKLIVIPISA